MLMTLSFLTLYFLICEIVTATVSLDGIKKTRWSGSKDSAYCTVGTRFHSAILEVMKDGEGRRGASQIRAQMLATHPPAADRQAT